MAQIDMIDQCWINYSSQFYYTNQKYQMESKKVRGIKRNKTEIFKLCKEARRKKSSRFSKQNLLGLPEDSFLTPSSIKDPLVEVQMLPTMSSLPPEWVQRYQQCLSTISKIDGLKKRILAQQNKRLSSVKLSDEKQADRQIYELATAATSLIRKCENNIEQIKASSRLESETDQKTCKNICVGLALTIQQKTKELRSQQRAFMEQRKNIQQSTKVSFLELAAEKVLEDDYIEDQKQKMEEIEFKIDEERNSEILKIVQSIHELNDLYKDLNHLVIVQGSLLDRIDYNIDESAVYIKKGAQTLQRVDQRQKKSKCVCRMMAIMIIAVSILGIILIVRWTH